MIQLQWLPSVRGSLWYAAGLSEQELTEPVRSAVAPLARELAQLWANAATPRDVPRRPLWDTLLIAEATRDSGRDEPPAADEHWPAVAADWLAANEFSPAARDATFHLLVQLVARFTATLPRLAGELPLRIGPLRSQWEAYGPGLMRCLARQIPLRDVPGPVPLLLVHPVRGGGGRAWTTRSTIVFEGVLANRQPRLPEVVRLVWLLAQHPAALARSAPPPGAGEGDSREVARELVSRVVAAAAELDLVQADDATVALACQEWRA